MNGEQFVEILWRELGEVKTIHVYPFSPTADDPAGDTTPHNTRGRTCWCGPRVEQQCAVCLAGNSRASCPHCDEDGFVPAFTDSPDWPTVVVHNDVSRASIN